jgi:hypothetical protein
MRYIKGDFVVIGPDIEPTGFKTRREANGCRASQSLVNCQEDQARSPEH